MTSKADNEYLVYVCDGCDNCSQAKALLDYCGAEYKTKDEECDEWPVLPAIYLITPLGKELIGGYAQLCELLLQDRG